MGVGSPGADVLDSLEPGSEPLGMELGSLQRCMLLTPEATLQPPLYFLKSPFSSWVMSFIPVTL